jgi:hypothetical protein
MCGTDNSVASTVLQYFTCTPVSENRSVVQAYPAVSCQSSEYESLMGLFYFILAVYVIAAPVAMLIYLLWANHKNKLTNPKHGSRYGVM